MKGTDPSPSFADLKKRLSQGDASAAADVFRRFAEQLIRLASTRLVGMLRRKIDAEDLVQSAFRSFFRVQAEQPFALHDWDDLWSLLATITLRKCGYQVRQFLTAKRNVTREVAAPEDAGSSWEAIAREPTPAEAALFGDTIEHWLRGLSERQRPIAELTLQGYTAAEIGPQVGLTARSVFRQLERIRSQLAKALAEET